MFMLRRIAPLCLIMEENRQRGENYAESSQCQAVNTNSIFVAVDFAPEFV